jgi:hypothetical protein
MRLTEFRIRDPFVLPDPAEGAYYLYGTTDENVWEGPGTGFDAYVSRDLVEWQGPFPVFRPPPRFWATCNFWAPEVHAYGGRLFMLASFKAPGVPRGTQILVADRPLGPFLPHGDGPVTPRRRECLDGTLFVEDGAPWMVFCREWVEVGDGRICAMRLAPDLKTAAGEPLELFRASAASWVRPFFGDGNLVTDGPFLHRTDSGALLMLWSSMGERGYAIGVAVSASGQVIGPWRHGAEPLFADDGGHGMVFESFDGRPMLALHMPNVSPRERARIIDFNTEAALRMCTR